MWKQIDIMVISEAFYVFLFQKESGLTVQCNIIVLSAKQVCTSGSVDSSKWAHMIQLVFNPLNPELNPICYFWHY